MMRKPLAFFIHDLRAGGAERSVVRLVNGIAARGHDVDLVVIRREGPFFGELDPRVNVVELPQSRTVTAIWGLRRYIDRARPPAVVSSMTHTNVASILARMAARHKPHLVVVEHNNFARNRAALLGLVRIAYDVVPYVYRLADTVAVVADGMREPLSRIARMPASSIEVLYNPVVTPELYVRAEEEPRHPWFAPNMPPVLLGIGRFTAQKNFRLLIEAFAKVRQQRAARLLILGDGALRADLLKRAQELGVADDLDLPGFDPNPFAYLRRAASFVLSSDWEGLPTVLIEALACGCPVVSTDCETGPREILEGGRYGRLVSIGDAGALAEAILATLTNPGDGRERRRRADRFDIDHAVDRYLEVAHYG